MHFDQFSQLLKSHEKPVILLEGTRQLPDDDAPQLVALSQFLATQFPHAQFRTGNASGSDESFAQGVCAVDASRLEYVLPHATMRANSRDARSVAVSYESLDVSSQNVLESLTINASPKYKNLMEKRHKVRNLAIKSNYLLRDTLKVVGDQNAGLSPATIGIFYVNVEKINEGGTAHTIRVCATMNVPVIVQSDWMSWPFECSK